MAKTNKNTSKKNNSKNDIEDVNATDGMKLIAHGQDPKHRNVNIHIDGKLFHVSKPHLNEPVLETFKTEKEARTRFDELLEDTQN